MQEERLFGAPSLLIGMLSVTLLTLRTGGCSIVVSMQPSGRKQTKTLHVNVPVEQSPSHVLGLVAPLIHMHYVTPKTWSLKASHVADRLGADGYEVNLS